MSIDKKLPHIVTELTEDELIAIATGSKEPVTFEKLTDAGKFVYEFKIKPGKTKIEAQLIYYHYRLWKGWENKPTPKARFFRDFKKYFQADRDKNGIFYMLNERPFDTSDETYWEMRALLRREKVKRRNTNAKEKNAKKQG